MRHEEYMKQAMKADEAGAPFKIKDELGGIPSMVDNPPHYNQSGIECKDKPLEDLQKAQWYLNTLLEDVAASDES